MTGSPFTPAALSRVREEKLMAFLGAVRIPHHGMPRVALLDNGPQLITEVLRNLCELIGTRKRYTSRYCPQGNSVCESFMRAFEKALSALASEDGCNWDLHLLGCSFRSQCNAAYEHEPVRSSSCMGERRYFRFKGTWIRRCWTLRRWVGLLDCGYWGYMYTKLMCKRL